jgi:hypothetical protein
MSRNQRMREGSSICGHKSERAVGLRPGLSSVGGRSSTSVLSRGLAASVGDIVEACRDMGRAARGRREPTSLHQGARRRVEVVVARRTGDREGTHRPRWTDGEIHTHHTLRPASARGVRIEEAATDGGAYLPYIGRRQRCGRFKFVWRNRLMHALIRYFRAGQFSIFFWRRPKD